MHGVHLSQAYLCCVAVGSPWRLLHSQAHRGDRSLRDLDRVDHLLRRLVHHVEPAHDAAGAKTPETLHGINRTLPPPVLFSGLQEKLCQFSQYCFIDLHCSWVLLSVGQVWQMSGSDVTWRGSAETSHTTDTLSFLGWANLCKWTQHWHSELLRPARLS